ncbi:MAG: pentapeptide repeat-containing protein [Nostocaceae cyanobacterium]|nr:pentapeptide repeat-containing protein [Nostocaceae cyanobacterium]
MSSGSGLTVTKPVSMWNKSIQADFKELFKSLGKAAIDTALGKWDSVATDVVDASAALGLATKPEEIAWLLIYRSLVQAMVSLLEGNQELLIKKPNIEDINTICDYRLNLSLESLELCIDQDFFRHPQNLPIVKEIKIPFAQWLESFGIPPAQAETISHRLPTYFVYALHEEWAKHADKYAILKEEIDTPFTQANEREQSWQRYLAWLQKQVEEPMFLEAFGLKQVYVPLCAYYKCRVEGEKDDDFERRIITDKKEERVIIELETELEAWLDKSERNDAIRVLSGGPGSGKSSFTKMFAARQAKRGKIRVLFIPLHHFESGEDLVDAVGKFVRLDGFLRHNPLEVDDSNSRLLIIFDGLDELAMQGKAATEVAQQFVREVQKKVDRFNLRETRLQVLVSGRELVVQANNNEFRKSQQILHILPYFVNDAEKETENYIDNQNLLKSDKRQLWWQLYGKASGRGYKELPSELDKGKLTEITSQPLLNYLVALSYVRGEVQFSQESNLNVIYADLLKAVYERGWAGYQHPSLQGIQEKDFVRILEEIALASWHGDGRTTTVREIERHCDNSGLKRLLDIFQSGAKLGVTRLLTAFYFRQSGLKDGEKTFEFTHKSFGEYLTAKRIVREVKLIYKKLEERQQDPDEGWDEREALTRWAILCGASAMDEYLFNFVVDEMYLQNKSDVSNWQQILCHLIGFMLRHGMPMERINPRPDFQEENRQARNAEEALLAVLNACARVTENLSQIAWDYPEAFGAWISRLQGQRTDLNQVFCLNCLSFLDLQGCILVLKDFYKANLKGANLKWANLERANLGRVILYGANLGRVILKSANLKGADISRANLKGANISRANLFQANLSGVYLERANLSQANLSGAHIFQANLERANLKAANLSGMNLEGINFSEANLEKAILSEANLEAANFKAANLSGANLEGANLSGANFERANLRGTILEGKDLNEISGSGTDASD